MPRVLLALLVVAGVSAGVSAGVLWLVTRADGPRARTTPTSAPLTVEPAATKGESAPLARAPAAPAPEPVVSTPAREPGPAAREAMPGLPAEELASARWVEGRVVVPPGTPADEELFVSADGRDFEGQGDHRVRVEPDGSFRVAFREGTRAGRIELVARYLYLPEPWRWKHGETSAPLVLEPRLGGRIVGRVRAPADAGGGDVVGRVELFRAERGGGASSSRQIGARSLGPAREPAFAFDALAPSEEGQPGYELGYDGERFVGRLLTVAVEPGRTRTVELELRPGVTLTGVVRDEQGAPLADVRVSAAPSRPAGPWSEARHRSAQSASDGSFRLGALAPGEIRLEAEREGFVPLERELGVLAADTPRNGLELVLARGGSIAGRVQWPDGSPALADLRFVPLDATGRWLDPSMSRSDERGAFAVSGLAAGAYHLLASATRTDADGQPASWNGEVVSVPTGTRTLVLTLAPGLELAGTASDERGTPLADFQVTAERVDGLLGLGPEKSGAFFDADGRFLLTGLAPGAWELTATSSGHARSAPAQVTLPALEPVALVLPRGASLQGRVLGPSGAPVRDARVGVPQGGLRGREGDARSDGDGRFELEPLAPGPLTLVARAEGFAPSAPLELEPVAGERVDGLVLRLRAGARIVGELVGSDGRPQPGRDVLARAAGHQAGVVTDAGGRFELGGLPPGEIRLSALTSEGIAIQEYVTLSEGTSLEVRLEAPTGLVRLHGSVRAGGEPLAGARLFARFAELGGKQDRGSSWTETDPRGTYALSLPGPGVYWLAIHGGEEGGLSWRVRVDAPAVAELALDVTIPLGRISGRVLDARGAPLAGIRVTSTPEQHEGAAHGSACGSSAEDGSYELLVPAGRHAVEAGQPGPRTLTGTAAAPGSRAPYAEARVRGLVVAENGHLRGVDLVLEAGGTLTGIVRNADGSGAGGAVLWQDDGARGEELGRCDELGRFELAGVRAGSLRLGARGRAGASELVALEVRAGETTRVELTLVPATLVHLSVRQDGQPVGSEIEAFDAHGERQAVQSGENGEAWLGPLVPGSYTVRAERDGQRVERGFEVAGATEELELALAFE